MQAIDALQLERFFRQDITDEERRNARATIDIVIECGYASIADEICSGIGGAEGKTLGEIGCGLCWHAPLLLARGAGQYVGIDQYKDLDSNQIFDRKFAGQVESHSTNRIAPMSIRSFIECFTGLEIHNADFLNYVAEGKFDAFVLLTVTEHLPDPKAIFQAISLLLRDGGAVYFSHQNYYCWNGHHLPPRTIGDFDPANPLHLAVADWAHVRNLIGNTTVSDEYLNRIRVHELMEIVASMYQFVNVQREFSTPERGAVRLTDEIRLELGCFYEEELLLEMLYCTARKTSDGFRPPIVEGTGQHALKIELTWCHIESGECFITRVPAIGIISNMILVEDGVPLGPGNAPHARIRQEGRGAYSLWGNYLYFSSSDNTSPIENGRAYELISNLKVST
jgi:SAM-dependent methyltransferase